MDNQIPIPGDARSLGQILSDYDKRITVCERFIPGRDVNMTQQEYAGLIHRIEKAEARTRELENRLIAAGERP